MSETIETIEVEGKTGRLMYATADDLTNPRQDDGRLLVMAFNHGRYTLGDKDGHDGYHRVTAQEVVEGLDRTFGSSSALTHLRAHQIIERWLRFTYGATYIQWVGLLDHSGISLFKGSGHHPQDPGGWDSGTLGVMFDTEQTRKETGVQIADVPTQADAEFSEYNSWVQGDVYQYEIVTTQTCNLGHEHEDVAESLYGIVGYEYAMQELRMALGIPETQPVTA